MKLQEFQVTNFRNVLDSGPVRVSDLTALVGQNEAGKSNLCEALWKLIPADAAAKYNVNEDWPADKWGQRNANAVVCRALFEETEPAKLAALFAAAAAEGETAPASVLLRVQRDYQNQTSYAFEGAAAVKLDLAKATPWITENLPKCVYIRDYDISGNTIELNNLQARLQQVGFNGLNNEEQTILIVLQLAQIDLNDFVQKSGTPEGRTLRAFDKKQASAYLTQQFAHFWKQKKVHFDIEVDGPTLNIFVEDDGLGMPVRLSRRSTGFRWYVSFAWKFTHASKGEYKNCILLLEEPGVHLHHAGHQDLLRLFEELGQTNTIIYTTHLATMLDAAYPERVRIIEVHDHHTTVLNGIVSKQRQPMMVIEAALGLSGSLSGLLGNRQTLIVEGGIDALLLQKLSGILEKSGKTGLSDRIYMFPAESASKTPMYAALLVGNKWDAGVLLDTDQAGKDAKKKVSELYLPKLADGQKFRVLMLGDAAGLTKTDAAIEDLFPDDFYIECVNEAYGVAIKDADLPLDGNTQIANRVEAVLVSKHGKSKLDKELVMGVLLRRFDGWSKLTDLPAGTAARAEKLFGTINAAFA
jgi:energy-coupling factor transporter ATP-binding protein EcfA2